LVGGNTRRISNNMTITFFVPFFSSILILFISFSACHSAFFFFLFLHRPHIFVVTGWTVRGSNPGGARFSASVQTGPGGHLASCTASTGSLSRD
jgi:hypothetical protein